MLPEISEIKARRKQLGLTQAQLAEMAAVSQSLVAKVEAGSLTPTYDKAKKLFDALSRLIDQREVTAKDVMSSRIVSVSPKDPLRKAVKLMQGKAISQLPVIEGGRAVGRLSERNILSRMGKPSEVDLNAPVESLMGEAMPVIQENTPFHLLSEMLEINQAVLIARKGRVKGIVSKSDLLKAILRKR